MVEALFNQRALSGAFMRMSAISYGVAMSAMLFGGDIKAMTFCESKTQDLCMQLDTPFLVSRNNQNALISDRIWSMAINQPSDDSRSVWGT